MTVFALTFFGYLSCNLFASSSRILEVMATVIYWGMILIICLPSALHYHHLWIVYLGGGWGISFHPRLWLGSSFLVMVQCFPPKLTVSFFVIAAASFGGLSETTECHHWISLSDIKKGLGVRLSCVTTGAWLMDIFTFWVTVLWLYIVYNFRLCRPFWVL